MCEITKFSQTDGTVIDFQVSTRQREVLAMTTGASPYFSALCPRSSIPAASLRAEAISDIFGVDKEISACSVSTVMVIVRPLILQTDAPSALLSEIRTRVLLEESHYFSDANLKNPEFGPGLSDCGKFRSIARLRQKARDGKIRCPCRTEISNMRLKAGRLTRIGANCVATGFP
jgi:hypothetical protein